MVEFTKWCLSKAIVVSATLPCIPPAMAGFDSHIYTIFSEDAKVFLVCGADGRVGGSFGYVQ